MAKHKSCDTLNNLPIDTACVTVISQLQDQDVELEVFWQSDECDQCEFVYQGEVTSLYNKSFEIDTAYSSQFLINATNGPFNGSSCSFGSHLTEQGKYYLSISESKDLECKENCLVCDWELGDVPDIFYTYLPVLVAFLVLFGAALLWHILQTLYRRGALQRLFRRNSEEFVVNNSSTLDLIDDNNHSGEVVQAQPKKERLRSLDTFRGIAIVLMIFVNYGGGQYYFFDHLPWNGLSIADLVFPWFVWIMGVSIAISLHSLIKRATPKKKIMMKIMKRSFILFALGIILNTSYGANDLIKLRIPGVLQRFSISYLVVASMHTFFAKPSDSHTDVWWSKFRDVLLYWPEWIMMLFVLALQVILTFALEVPGCPKGYLGPGGLHDDGQFENCTGGASGYIDRLVFGSSHIYSRPTCYKTYETKVPYDPEGLLGCLTSIFLTFLGLQAGKIVLTYKTCNERIPRWFFWAFLTGLIAIILCCASKNNGWIPVNKNLWSVSYIMTASCFAFVLLIFCYYIQDVKKWWSGSPFYYAGMNSILLYVGHQLTGSLFPWSWSVSPESDSHAVQLAMDIWGTAIWMVVAYKLYLNQFFLSI